MMNIIKAHLLFQKHVEDLRVVLAPVDHRLVRRAQPGGPPPTSPGAARSSTGCLRARCTGSDHEGGKTAVCRGCPFVCTLLPLLLLSLLLFFILSLLLLLVALVGSALVGREDTLAEQHEQRLAAAQPQAVVTQQRRDDSPRRRAYDQVEQRSDGPPGDFLQPAQQLKRHECSHAPSVDGEHAHGPDTRTRLRSEADRLLHRAVLAEQSQQTHTAVPHSRSQLRHAALSTHLRILSLLLSLFLSLCAQRLQHRGSECARVGVRGAVCGMRSPL
mmetsp:Transcript_46798/g.109231  ORF Transcript_46798/g.109231 Transcript_46798/m.109231 type:complete len:273 (-) Transcript_46798:883-1701(-)